MSISPEIKYYDPPRLTVCSIKLWCSVGTTKKLNNLFWGIGKSANSENCLANSRKQFAKYL